MKRKLFLGIDLDPNLKKMLERATQEWQDLPIKWHKTNSLHLPLVFLGWVEEGIIIELSERLNQVCAEIECFDIEFEQIKLAYKKNAVENNSKNANRVLLEGAISEDLKELQKKLEKELEMYFVERKVFRPQITLGKMRVKRWKVLEDYPEIIKEFFLTMDVMNVALFEGSTIDEEYNYRPIDIFKLKN